MKKWKGVREEFGKSEGVGRWKKNSSSSFSMRFAFFSFCFSLRYSLSQAACVAYLFDIMRYVFPFQFRNLKDLFLFYFIYVWDFLSLFSVNRSFPTDVIFSNHNFLHFLLLGYTLFFYSIQSYLLRA